MLTVQKVTWGLLYLYAIQVTVKLWFIIHLAQIWWNEMMYHNQAIPLIRIWSCAQT